MTIWPNSADGASFDWLEYTADIDGELVRYKVNVSFYKSHWGCQFGSCPGVLVSGAMTDIACCQVGVGFVSNEEFTRVALAVAELTPEDAEHYDVIRQGHWFYYEGTKKKREIKGTTIIDGKGCVFANTNAHDKPGCALHHLAARTGRKGYDTKPDICWQIPLAVTEEYAEVMDQKVVVLDIATAAAWGQPTTDNVMSVGYWCTETPDAYANTEPVYVHYAPELRKLLGDTGYAVLKQRLDNAERKCATPGELANGGRKMLPLLVKERYDQWTAGAQNRDELGQHCAESITNSADYLEVQPGQGCE